MKMISMCSPYKTARALCFTLLLCLSAFPAAATETAIPGVKWGAQVTKVDHDQITVNLKMVTGNCMSPPMKCDNQTENTPNGVSVSGSCTADASMYGTAGEEHVIPAMNGETFKVGDSADVWIGDGAPTFKMPECLNR